MQTKREKDLWQAAQVLEVLFEDRAGDVDAEIEDVGAGGIVGAGDLEPAIDSRSHARAWISHSVLATPRYFSSRVNRSSVAGM